MALNGSVRGDGRARRAAQTIYQWVTQPEHFALKTISKDGDQRVEYRHINFAKQPDRYIELPMDMGELNRVPHTAAFSISPV